MDIENGEIFARVMARAIEHDESELKELSVKRRNPRQTTNSVRHYYEPWLWPAFVKEAWRDPSCPEIDWEKAKVDCSFLGADGKITATFELKPFFPVKPLKAVALGEILRDFGKQLEQAKRNPSVEHYVALVPYGDATSVAEWMEQTLRPTLEKVPSMKLDEISAPQPIPLNHKDEGFAFVKVFRVTSQLS